MATLSYQTAGESHGPALLALVNGLPAGTPVDAEFINAELRRRQGGYGRGGRQRIETDVIEVLSGVRRGHCTGAPVTMKIANKDSRLDDLTRTPPVYTPRPGHADLAGSIKYLTTDCRETLERASARETCARVAAGALARCLLRELGIEVFGFVRSIHQAKSDVHVTESNWKALVAARDASDTYCPDASATKLQEDAIHRAKVDKTTVGGVAEAHVFGLPPGIGSTMDWRDRLDARIAQAVMGVQAIKGVEIGLGFACAERFGHEVHDPIAFDASKKHEPSLGFVRSSNNAGGLEGGMTNGAALVVRAAMKPISTLLRGMPSVDLNTKQSAASAYERSDICAVSAASVVIENVVAFEVAACLREKFGGDSLIEVREQMRVYLELARKLPFEA
jgi:chorismate synthase